MEPYHVIVIGAGSGGLVCAAGGAMLGARVALVEKHKMGGDCLNTGCVPSKSIIRAAKLNYDAKRSEQFGLSLQTSPVNLKSVLDSVRKVIKKIEPHDSVERFRGLGVDVYQSSFHFKSPWEITDGGQILKAKRFVIATGSSPRVPNISGIETIPYLTSENVWDLEELPRRMVVLGGGPIGTELAQTFSRLGSEVTLVQNRDRLLPREDSEVSEALKKIFEREGIRICLGHEARKIRESSGGYEIILIHPEKGSETVGFDQILIATGRTPNIEGLQLETAGVKFSSQGILVDAYLRTKAKHIFACGDVAGHFLFTHTAAHQARTVLRNALFPGNSKIDYRVVPWSTFTDPEVARVGLNEAEAKNFANLDFKMYLEMTIFNAKTQN